MVRKVQKHLKKSNWQNRIIYIIITASIIGLISSAYNIVKYIIDNNNTKSQITIIKNNTIIQIIGDNNNTEIIEQQEEIPKSNPYWDYINMNLIDVNFAELKKTNDDIKGWIKVYGTNINYPFVQTNNNEYYLKHSLDKSKNSAGWVFLDYRNDLADFNNKNTILYAHGRLDNSMFGSLRKILTSDWLQDTNNFVINLSTEFENTLWQVFSVYQIPTTSDYIQVNFKDDIEFKSFANKLITRSQYQFNTTISETDRILTLSTCYNNSDKVVLHAKLIKRTAK